MKRGSDSHGRTDANAGLTARLLGSKHVAFWTIVAGVAAVAALIVPFVTGDDAEDDGLRPIPTGSPVTELPTTQPQPTDPPDPGPEPTGDESAEPSPLPRSPVPDGLVGSWGGGSEGATAGRSYTFGRRGDVLYRRGDDDIEGTVVVEGDKLTLHFPGSAPQTYRWSTDSYSLEGYTFSNLYLDGFTYVRQDSP